MSGSGRFLRRTVWEEIDPAALAARYAAGASLDELGFLTGTSSYAVRRILVRMGVEIRPRFGRGVNPKRYTRS